MKRTKPQLPECFQDFFKFQDECDNGAPVSGMVYDMLPGLSRDVVSAWVDPGKYSNADDLACMALINAIGVIKMKLTGTLSAMNVEINNSPERITACDMTDRIAECTVAGWRGIRVVMRDRSSMFACLRVEHVFVKTCSAESITLHVRDENYNVIYSKNLDTLPGVPVKVEINQDFDTQIVYIGFDQQGVNVYESECSRRGPCCGSHKGNAQALLYVDGWDGTFAGAGKINSRGYGVTACVSITCKDDQIICQFRDKLARALLYATGIYMVMEGKASRRINPETIQLFGSVDETLARWQAECDNSISAVIDSIKARLLKDNTCFNCCNRLPGYINVTS